MSDWYALYYPLTAGTEETVKELIRHGDRPERDITDGDGNNVGRLLSAIAFVGMEKAIHVIELSGPEVGVPGPGTLEVGVLEPGLLELARGYGRELEQYLSAPRDVTTEEGVRALLSDAEMPCALALGTVPDQEWQQTNWQALFYPLKPGTEEKVGELFAGTGSPDLDVLDEDGNKVGRLLRTMAFIGNSRALRVNQIEGTIEAVAAHMSRQQSAHNFQRELDQYLAVPRDMTDLTAARSFFMTAIMECVLAWRHSLS
jgi:SchA/CurD like domain-containing protein